MTESRATEPDPLPPTRVCAPDPAPEEPGERELEPLGPRYLDQGVFAQGGMSQLGLVLDLRLGQLRVIKQLKPELAQTDALVRQFVAEAQRTAGLTHPGVVPVHDLGLNANGLPSFSMSRVHGSDLSHWLREESERGTPQSELLARAVAILMKICEVLSYAHDQGLIHGDLKPGNIMVGNFGEAYLLDWGVCREKHARPRVVAGTPAYMSPEQAQGKPLDERSDVFSMGAILYELLTGTPPYVGSTQRDVLEDAKRGMVTDPLYRAEGVPRALSNITMRALCRDPAQRHATAGQLRDDLEAFLRGTWRFEQERFKRGCLLIQEGDQGERAFTILRGRCLVFKTVDGEERTLKELGPGDSFGEIAILSDIPRSASVRALTEVDCRIVARETFQDWLALDPCLAGFMRFLAERVLQRDAELLEAQDRCLAAQVDCQAMLHMAGRRSVPLSEATAQLGGALQISQARVRELLEESPLFEVEADVDRLGLC